MTPDEVVKKLGDMSSESNHNEFNVLASAISIIQDYQKLKEEADRLRVQLVGCGVAALGYATGKNAIEKGSYGYSASFQDVVDLQDKYQKLRGKIDKAQVRLEQARILSVKEPMQLSDRINLNGIIREAQSYLKQPTEH